MAATGIDIKKLISLTAYAIAIEVFFVALGPHLFANSMIITGAARICQILAILLVFFSADGNLSAIGIRLPHVVRGVKRGMFWSAGFGLAAGLAAVLIYSAGLDPIALIGGRLPAKLSQVILLLVVGGFIGPVAEELFFRGVVYGFLRRWGVLSALLISTAVFVLVHFLVRPVQGFAIVQAIGGVVFAASYELEKNLLVPITIHCLGNLAIFLLPVLR